LRWVKGCSEKHKLGQTSEPKECTDRKVKTKGAPAKKKNHRKKESVKKG